MRGKGGAENSRGHKKNIGKRNLLKRRRKVQFSPKKYRFFERTEKRSDNGKYTSKEKLYICKYEDRTTLV